MIFLMNSAVMPSGCYGTYTYQRASLQDLLQVLQDRYGPWVSTIGYPQNVDLIEKWTGIRIPVNRVSVQLVHGDSALIMRLKERIADPKTKGAPVSEDPEDWEFAWVHYSSTITTKR